MLKPRSSRLSWEDSHMLTALLAAQRSPDPNTQVGAVIVKNNRRISSGYNGFPNNINTSLLPWDRKADSILDTKYPYVIHAETNAIHNATTSVEGSTIFVTLFPCNICMQNIIQSGIKDIVYLDDKYKDIWENKASKIIANSIDLKYVKHTWSKNAALSIVNILDIISSK